LNVAAAHDEIEARPSRDAVEVNAVKKISVRKLETLKTTSALYSLGCSRPA